MLLSSGFLLMWAAWATVQLQHMGFSLWWLPLLWSTDSRVLWPQLLQHVGSVAVAPGLWSTASVVVAHGLSCFRACGIFPEQGSNWRLLHWQEDSLPLSLQESLEAFKFVFERDFHRVQNSRLAEFHTPALPLLF